MATRAKGKSAKPGADGANKVDTQAAEKKRLRELIAVVTSTAKRKGWTAELVSEDTDSWRYATISVYRTAPNTMYEITGLFEITKDKRIRISYQKTSFYGWGLDDLQKAIKDGLEEIPWLKMNSNDKNIKSSELDVFIGLLRRFRQIARQLQTRHASRPPLLMNDEYDVQDLVHALLRGLFNDVRSEEYVPSYGGGSSRMDFLLKSESVAIEVKFASATLRDRQIGEQLIIDIKRYKNHPDCKRLVCFVYDPGGFLANPSGLEADLSGKHDSLDALVIAISV